ncbi:MAG: carotenoid biosynthesis protein [Bacteroidales bacterium]|nr:carotenoid biosynthesis protein [Bacteroidales bacterium]
MTEEKRIRGSTKILLWVYGVGLAGMLLPFTRELFIKITPLNLLFAAAFLFYGEKPALRVIITGTVIAVASFLIEAYGVNTGKIFGHYTYGKALGPALLNTPLIIGLNWFLLIYCTNVISRQIWDSMAQGVSGRKMAPAPAPALAPAPIPSPAPAPAPARPGSAPLSRPLLRPPASLPGLCPGLCPDLCPGLCPDLCPGLCPGLCQIGIYHHHRLAPDGSL